MTLIDERKLLDGKIKANQAQHDLDSGGVEISELSSTELDKYK